MEASAQIRHRGRVLKGSLRPVVRDDEGVVAIEIDEKYLDHDTLVACASGNLRAFAESELLHGVAIVNGVMLTNSVDGGTTWLDDWTHELSGANNRWRRAIATDKARGLSSATRRVRAHARPAGFKEKRIELEGEICASTAATLLAAIREASGATIVLAIDSPGGKVRPAREIYDALLAHKHAVRVEIEGKAASAASLLAMAGDVRRIDKNGSMMVHLPWIEGGAFNERNLPRLALALKQTGDHLAAVYSSRTGRALPVVKSWLAKETTFGPIEALQLGLVHAVTTRGVTIFRRGDVPRASTVR